MGPREVTLRTDLTRDQQRYCEEKGYLGPVARNGGGERAFTDKQVAFFEKLAALRKDGVNLEEAAALAAEAVDGGVPIIHDDRLEVLLERSARDLDRSLRSAQVLWRLAHRRAKKLGRT